MESELQAFLDNIIDSLIKLEIVLFLHGNPGTMDTAHGIAMRIYRNTDLTSKALRDLSEHGILQCATLGAGTYTLYSLSQDENLKRLLEVLDERYHSDRTTMVEIIRRFAPKNQPVTPSDGTVRSE